MEKYLAGIITASLLIAVLATAGLGELALKDYPKFFPAVPLIVVGDSADHPVATEDVVAAIDISVTLAELMTQEKPIPGIVVPTVEGKEFKGLALGGSVPTSTLTKTHISFLKWEGIRYKDVDYTVREKVELPTIQIRGAVPGTGWGALNGTLYLDLSELESPLEYKLEFVGGAPNISEVDYENPLKLSVLGREFSIVQVKNNSFVALAGVVGDASKDTPVKFETYEFYAVDGAETWIKIQVKDATGNVVDTKIINKGAIGSFTLGGKTIYVKPLQVWVSTITNTVTARIVVGTQIDKEYKSGDKYFDSNIFQWDINSSGGKINYIGVKLLPSAETNTDKIKIGEKLDFAEKYFELGFLGTEVTSYATFTVTPVKVDVYDKNGQNKLLSSKAGLEIASDFPVFESETYKKAYLVPVGTDLANVTIGFLDPVKGLILAKERAPNNYWYDATADEVKLLNVKYGTTVFDISLTNTGLTFDLEQDVVARYNFTANEFRLGLTKASAESSDVNVAGTDVGDKDFDITTAYGVIVEKPKTNAASDKLVLKVPSEAQKVTVYVGKKGEVKAEGKTYKEFALVPGAIGKLDTEVLTADKKSLKPEYYNRHLILVGDSAVNRLSALAHNLPFPTYGADPAYKEKYGIKGSGESFIWVMKNPFGVNPNQIVVEVAGWDAADTRLAALALQAGKLKDWGITTGKVILRGTELASVTHEAVTG
jgi:hypothetical protein